MLLIESKIGDWFDFWHSEPKRKWKLPDFELVAADYEGRVA